MCVHCDFAVDAAMWVLKEAQKKGRIPDKASTESIVLGMSKGGWEGWMQEEMVVPFFNKWGFNVFREVNIYKTVGKNDGVLRVDLLIDPNRVLLDNEDSLLNFAKEGAWGIELKCQGLFQGANNFRKSVENDFEKIRGEFVKRKWRSPPADEASPLISLVVWLKTAKYKTFTGSDGKPFIELFDPLYEEEKFKTKQSYPMRKSLSDYNYTMVTVAEMWTVVAYHP